MHMIHQYNSLGSLNVFDIFKATWGSTRTYAPGCIKTKEYRHMLRTYLLGRFPIPNANHGHESLCAELFVGRLFLESVFKECNNVLVCGMALQEVM